jgi:hypothetical protein
VFSLYCLKGGILMKKLLAFLLSLFLVFALSFSSAETAYYQQQFDVLHRSLKVVHMKVSMPVSSSMEFFSRYAFGCASVSQDEPLMLFTSIADVYGETLAAKIPYAYKCTSGVCSVAYDQSMNCLYYEIRMFDSRSGSYPSADQLLSVIDFIQCLEAGYSVAAKALAAGYSETLASMCTPLAMEAFNAAVSGQYGTVMFQSDNFAYIVEKLSIPAMDGNSAYDTYSLIAMPKQW